MVDLSEKADLSPLNKEVQVLINKLDLRPHPEGGFFKETYRSQLDVELHKFAGPRSVSTGIYYMLTGDDRSHFHRIKSDEMWHFYAGQSLRIVMLSPSGEKWETVLGRELERGEVFQFVVPAGVWFGAELVNPNSYTLVGCTVAPGFDFFDFELADRKALLAEHPNESELIEHFCLS